MRYTNKKIEDLISRRDAENARYNYEIEREIQKEKATRKFSRVNFLLVVSIFIGIPLMFELNAKIFPKDSIWSWSYYIK